MKEREWDMGLKESIRRKKRVKTEIEREFIKVLLLCSSALRSEAG